MVIPRRVPARNLRVESNICRSAFRLVQDFGTSARIWRLPKAGCYAEVARKTQRSPRQKLIREQNKIAMQSARRIGRRAS